MKSLKRKSPSTLLISIICILFVSYNSYCQNYTDTKFTNEGMFVQVRIDKEGTKIDGSSYYSDKWENGSIQFSNGMKIESDSINYNVYTGFPSYIQEGIEYSPIEDENIKNFTIGSAEFIYLKSTKDIEKKVFEIIYNNDKFMLLEKHDCIIVKGSEPKGYIKGKNDKFTIKSSYYVKYNAQPAIEFRTKKKDIFSLMNDKKSEIETFIRERNLNIKNERDLILVFEHYYQITLSK